MKHKTTGARRLAALLASCSTLGCGNAHHSSRPEPPASVVTFDGGGAPFKVPLPAPLPGNTLPLDGGVMESGLMRPALGELVFTVRDYDSRQPMPARVIFRPPPASGFADDIFSGKPSTQSPGSSTGAVVGPGVVGSPEGVLLQTGMGRVPVPPGEYDVLINRGPEWEAAEAHVSVVAGKSQPVNATLTRSVDTRGWLAADLHVHMNTSFDSRLPQDRRVISMATSGVELMATTDHHYIVDALPTVRALGYGPDEMTAISGDELNFLQGHAGVYPVAYDPNKPAGGSPVFQPYNHHANVCDQPWVGMNCFTDVDAFPLMHSLYPIAVVTVNHPWWRGADLGYFTNIGWGAGTRNPLPKPLRTAGLFDAFELLNGYQSKPDVQQALLADWFYLLSQGYRVTALGSSDTHKLNWVRSGFPRSWIRLPTERPGDVSPGDFAQAIKNGRVIASTGPFVTMTVDDGDIGDVVRPRHRGQVTVDITADAPEWMSLDTVQLFVNGVTQQKWTVKGGQRPLFSATITVPVNSDSWFVVVAGGKKPLPPDVVGEYSHANGYEMLPWAVTNPVYVDANGDGWHPDKTWGGAPLLAGSDFGWAGAPMPQLFGATLQERDAVVPADCDPDNKQPLETEPPLDAMQMALPLLYP